MPGAVADTRRQRLGAPILNRVTLLRDVGEIVSRSHDLGETLRNVVDLVAKRLDADVCSIYMVESDLSRLTLSATIGLRREAVGQVQLPVGEGLVGLAAQQRAPVVIENAQEHPRYKYFEETGEEEFASLMAVPLVVRGVTIGVIVVQTRQPRQFEPREVEVFETCAQLIAPVVINARLLSMVGTSEEEARQSAEELALHGVPIDSGRTDGERRVEFQGRSASRGIAIGTVYRLENPLDFARLDYTPNPDPKREESDLLQAINDARRSIDDNREELGEQFGPEFSAVFHTHVQILEDKGLVQKLQSGVRETGNALEALRTVLSAYNRLFSRIQDPYFKERVMDIEDVGRRVMEKLLGERHQAPVLEQGAVVVTDNILPSDFARLDLEKVGAFVAEHGGITSHGAIFARTLEIPAVTGVHGILETAIVGEMAIVDGGEGSVRLNPDEGLLTEYQRARERYEVAVEHLDGLRDRPAETLDGRRVLLTANCGLVSDLRMVDQHGADGIGLFRTEMLAFAHRGFPEEEEQEQLYERVAQFMAPRPVTIRTLDLGGDKGGPDLGIGYEDNPQLGRRSIRMSLDHLDTFRAQIRAILRASAGGNVRMLLPMISSLHELQRCREIVAECQDQMRRSGTAFDETMPIGVMIEVPSAALTSDILARESDFFSIGTNDLTQYTLAVDRGNENVAHLFDPLHPAVLQLIDRSVRSGTRNGIPVSVCGEVASNPLAVPILVGLGINELSGTPSAVPVVKEIVHALDRAEVEADARSAIEAESADDVRRIAAARLREADLIEHADIGPWLRSVIAKAEAAE